MNAHISVKFRSGVTTWFKIPCVAESETFRFYDSVTSATSSGPQAIPCRDLQGFRDRWMRTPRAVNVSIEGSRLPTAAVATDVIAMILFTRVVEGLWKIIAPLGAFAWMSQKKSVRRPSGKTASFIEEQKHCGHFEFQR